MKFRIIQDVPRSFKLQRKCWWGWKIDSYFSSKESAISWLNELENITKVSGKILYEREIKDL